MDVLRRAFALALFVAGSLTANAQTIAPPFVTTNEALETDGRSMSLPTAPDGMLTVTPCSSCTVKTLRATAKTVYKLRDQEVTLTMLRNVMATNSEIFVTVLYSKKTNELVSVTASADVPRTGSR